MEKQVLKFAWRASVAFVSLTIATWALAMIAVPPVGPYCPGNCMKYPFTDLLSYYPRDYYWLYVAIFQLFAYVIFISANHFIAPAEKRPYTFISVGFSLMAAVILLIDYFVQFSVIPVSVMKGESEGVALVTQYNEHGVFIAMEEIGYITMSVSLLFLGFRFSARNTLEKAIRLVLLILFLLTVLSFAFYSIRYGIDRSYRFEVAVISINWIGAITAGILIARYVGIRLRGTG